MIVSQTLRMPPRRSIYPKAAFRKKEPFMLSRRGVLAAALILAAAPAAFASEKPFSAAAFAAAQAAGKPIIIHVYAPWCPTCRAQEPILQKLESEPKFSGAETFRVDFDGQKDAVKALNARNQSTIIVFKGAKEMGRSVGETNEKAISALLDKAL
jgi:thioredoxin 1